MLKVCLTSCPMSKGVRIKQSIYNGGKSSLASLLALESDLEVLQNSSINLKKTLKGLDSIQDCFATPHKYYGGGLCVVDPAWAEILENQVQKQIIFLPQQGDYAARLMEALSFSFHGAFPNVLDKNKNRIQEINTQLRNLKQRLKLKYSREIFSKIRYLVLELRSLISFHLKKKRLVTKAVRFTINYYFTRDIKKFIRRINSSICKFLCDQAGSDEEEVLDTDKYVGNQFSYFFQFNARCSIHRNLLSQSMNTSN